MRLLFYTYLLTVACITVTGCTTSPLTAEPFTVFEPTAALEHEDRERILPSGVAVIHDFPLCDYTVIGEAKASTYLLPLLPKHIEALQAQAAVYGADAIVVHPNLPVCHTGEQLKRCPGRGEYVIASAIDYRENIHVEDLQSTLETSDKTVYDSIEFVEPEAARPMRTLEPIKPINGVTQ